MTFKQQSVAIIGAGPAGLMAAEIVSLAGIKVNVYDAMPSAGRKFLIAGKGGMNITHAEPFERLLSRYADKRAVLEPMLTDFPPQTLRNWVKDLGLDTFVGSSGRVFPTEMKAAPLLRTWLHRLKLHGVQFHMRHNWQGWTDSGELRFISLDEEKFVAADATVLALGGGSWPQLGSNGHWLPLLAERAIEIAPLKPANCGFEVSWSDYFRAKCAGSPLKSIRLSFAADGEVLSRVGELMLTEYGVEGGLIYAFSAPLREQIASHGSVSVSVDLCPDRDLANIQARLAKPRGKDSLANHLRKCLGLDAAKVALLREILSAEAMNDINILAEALKALTITLSAARPLAEAISTAGGVSFNSLDCHLMLHRLPGVFCAGEMLDWEAPTGGYLLTACMATGRAAGLGAVNWLQSLREN
jgi:uncharacterized flavoprotein (TIGR03862 family)